MIVLDFESSSHNNAERKRDSAQLQIAKRERGSAKPKNKEQQ